MLLCISDSEDTGVLSEYCTGRNLYMDIMRPDTQKGIKEAIARNRIMANYRFVLFWYPNETPDFEGLTEAVRHILTFYSARVVVLAPAGDETAQLFGRLAEMGLRELVEVCADTDLAAELAQCLSPEGKGYAYAMRLAADAGIEAARDSSRPAIMIPEGFILKIGVAGAQSRVGVTTQAFGLRHALHCLGFAPCIVDFKEEFIQEMLALYADESVVNGSVVSVRGIDFARDIQVDTEHNAFVYDLGVLEGAATGLLVECSIGFLCAGSKPWELPHLFFRLQAYAGPLSKVLISFSTPDEQALVNELLTGRQEAEFAPWNPDIWSAGGCEWYERLLVPLIREVVEKWLQRSS